jgi:hypothetical protein
VGNLLAGELSADELPLSQKNSWKRRAEEVEKNLGTLAPKIKFQIMLSSVSDYVFQCNKYNIANYTANAINSKILGARLPRLRHACIFF